MMKDPAGFVLFLIDIRLGLELCCPSLFCVVYRICSCCSWCCYCPFVVDVVVVVFVVFIVVVVVGVVLVLAFAVLVVVLLYFPSSCCSFLYGLTNCNNLTSFLQKVIG